MWIRNAVMACDGEALKAVNLKKWQTLSPNFIVPSDILESSFDRAKRDVGAIRTVEWDLYNQGLVPLHFHSGSLVRVRELQERRTKLHECPYKTSKDYLRRFKS